MAHLKDIEQLRSVTWAAKYLWDIKFDGAPAPFNNWFPAVDVDEGIANLETHQIDYFQSTYKFPKSTTSLDLRLTFFDSADNALLNWLEEWVNVTILNNGQYVYWQNYVCVQTCMNGMYG